MDTKTRHIPTVYKRPTSDHMYRLKVRRRKKVFHANASQKKPGVAIITSDTIDFKILL